MEDFLSLIEAANSIEDDVEALIRAAARDKLTVFVIANNWAVRRNGDSQSDKLNGQACLLPDDVLQGIGAESIPVSQVRVPDIDEVILLHDTQQVRRGAIYVTNKEFDRFCRQYALALKFDRQNAPFLNRNHEWYSSQLAIAVQAWMALFSEGEFDAAGKSTKHHIHKWLSKYAGQLPSGTRENIAKLINPDEEKGGGAPRTPAN